ncbi:AAA family ATPase [Jiella mangrovi]|uniref:AAA family ATPase n=1 Tax=Jiella mangrovi TaxID=2821407 RepID=A0ABS4BNN2_9HYPH|nr:AAA family ATPase [Jiella mangrovi]MBP0618271.1 AAA family ATPase [Jiella mangrovi]
MPLYLALPIVGFGGFLALSLMLFALGWLGTAAVLLWAFAAAAVAYHLDYFRLERIHWAKWAMDSVTDGVTQRINFSRPLKRLRALHGNRKAKERLDQVLAAIEAAPDRRRAFDPVMSATVFIFHGPRGTGKHTAAKAFAEILAGVGVFRQTKPVWLHANDVAYASAATLVDVASNAVRKARDGVILLEHAEWLVPATEADRERAIAFGRGLLRAVADGVPRPFIMIVGSDQLARRFMEDPSIRQAWLDRCHVEQVIFDDLARRDLENVFYDCLETRGVTIDSELQAELQSEIQKLQEAAGDHFANAIAIQQWFDRLLSWARQRRPDAVPEIRLDDARTLNSAR